MLEKYRTIQWDKEDHRVCALLEDHIILGVTPEELLSHWYSLSGIGLVVIAKSSFSIQVHLLGHDSVP